MKNLEARMIFGFLLLAVYLTLSIIIGLGKVEESTSHGLTIILNALSGMGGAWAVWAFSAPKE